MDNCYVPNNLSNQYGVDFQDPMEGSALIMPAPMTSSTQTQLSHGIWNFSPEEMGSFSISPLDMQDSVPSNFFSFSPCSSTPTSSNSTFPCKNDLGCYLSKHNSSSEIKQPHDMADVLLSLKHAIVHPGQMSPTCSSPSYYQSSPQYSFGAGPSASLSCTVYPHQVPSEVDPPDNMNNQQYSQYMGTFPDQAMSPSGCTGNTLTWTASHTQSFFPAMSVNVSMNMTMHGYSQSTPTPISAEGLQHQISCPQIQWTSITPNSSPIYQSSNLASPIPNSSPVGPTYSFTADIKAQQMSSEPFVCTATSPSPFKMYKSCRSQSPTTSPCMKVTVTRTSKSISPAMDLDKDKPNLCRICGKTYARPSTLKTHLRTHSGEKPYRCEDCNKSFSQAANLTAHVRTHSGEKPFRCPICGRRFSQSSSVTTHMRTHSGERPYRCRLCKKAFSDSSTLTKHLRIHSGEKPYQCKLCQLRFSQSGNLNRHMRVHSTLGANILFS